MFWFIKATLKEEGISNSNSNALPNGDNDVIPDYLDIDSDGDGIPDADPLLDTNGDGEIDDVTDNDNDGIVDVIDDIIIAAHTCIAFIDFYIES